MLSQSRGEARTIWIVNAPCQAGQRPDFGGGVIEQVLPTRPNRCTRFTEPDERIGGQRTIRDLDRTWS